MEIDGGESADRGDGGDPAARLALIEEQTRHVRRRVNVDPAVLCAIWGVAWLVGFGAAYLAYGPNRVIPAWLGPTLASVLIAAGMVASIGYSVTVGRGVSGGSRTSEQMYGWSWTLGFLCLAVVNSALTQRGLPSADVALLWSGTSLLLVGVLYLAGGALWRDWVMFGLGVWTMCSAAGAVLAGVPGNFLVLAVAGGGGFLSAALYHRVRTAPRRRLP